MGQTRRDRDALYSQLAGHLESYVLRHGEEDSRGRVLGRMQGADPGLLAAVWADHADNWWAHPNVDRNAWVYLEEAVTAMTGATGTDGD